MRDADALIKDYNISDNLRGYFREAVRLLPEAVGRAVRENMPQIAKEQGASKTDNEDELILSPQQVNDLFQRTIAFLDAEIDEKFGENNIIGYEIYAAFVSELSSDEKREIFIERLNAATQKKCIFSEPEAP
jgi:hypothetical protein